MIKIKIAETAQKNGLKSAYALQKALSISPTIAARLWKGDFDKLGINTLDKLCQHFDCQPNEFFEYHSAQGKSITQFDNSKMLSTKEVAVMTGKSERWVRELCKKGDVPAEKTDKGWLIREMDAKKITV